MMLNTGGTDSGGWTAILSGGIAEFRVSPRPFGNVKNCVVRQTRRRYLLGFWRAGFETGP